jgi:hypothetical protein
LSLFKHSFYAKGYIGFNNKTENFSDEFRSGLEIGTSFVGSKLLVLLRSNMVKSFRNGSLNASNNTGSIFANNVEFISIGGEVAWKFTKKIGLSLGYDSAFSGKVIYAAPSYNAGFFYLLK